LNDNEPLTMVPRWKACRNHADVTPMDTKEGDRGIKAPIRRNLKDSIFSDLFSEEWYADDLARELFPGLPEGIHVKATNAGGVMAPGPIHDLVLIAGNYAIIAAEAQSTRNPNMPMRILAYEFDVLEPLLRGMRAKMLRGVNAQMPMVLSFVIYTGTEEVPDVMRLTDSMPGRPPKDCVMELSVKVIHARNAPAGSKVGEYIEFCQIADRCRRESGGDMELYAHCLRKVCEKADILQEYLRVKWVEVMGYYEDIFNQDVADEAMRLDAREEGREEGLAEGIEKGMEKGMEKGRAEVAVRLLADGMDPEKVAQFTDLSIEEVMNLKASNRVRFILADSNQNRPIRGQALRWLE